MIECDVSDDVTRSDMPDSEADVGIPVHDGVMSIRIDMKKV